METSHFWSQKNVLIPGGCGVIGSHVTEQLVEQGARVTALDNLTSGDWERLSALGDRVTRVEGDVTDPMIQKQCFPGSDVVLDLAGLAPGLTLDEGRHQRLYVRNVEIASAVLNAVVEHGVPRLLVVSSSCVYPDDAPVPTPEISLLGTEPESSNRGYGLAKREIERQAISAAKNHPWLSLAVARPFNVYGVRDCNVGPGAHVIPSLLNKVLADSHEVVVWGSGRQTRSFIHAADLARALILVTELHAKADPVNVGSPDEIALGELARDLLKLSGVQKPLRFDTTKPEGAVRKGADISKLQEITGGFEAKVAWKDGLAEIVKDRLEAANYSTTCQ